MKFKRIGLVGIVIVAACALTLELYKRLSEPHVHRPFAIHQIRVAYPLSPEKSYLVDYFYNGNGARGYNYRGETYKVAVIGDSSALDLFVTQQESWMEHLEKLIPAPTIVESYGVDSVGEQDLTDLLHHFRKQGRHYDLLLVLHTFGVSRKSPVFRYSQRFGLLPQSPIHLIPMRWAERVVRQSEIVEVGRRLLEEMFPSVRKVEIATPPTKTVFNKRLRHSGQFEYAYETTIIGQTQREQMREDIKAMIRAAKEISSHQIFIPGFFAYSDENPDFIKAYSIMRPTQKKGVFHNPKSLSDHSRARREAALEILHDFDAHTFDWELYFLPAFEIGQELFIDEVHLSPKGARMFARDLSERIGDLGLLPPEQNLRVIRTENK